jgi:hypothetical protein
MKIPLGDFNAKEGRENIFVPTIGNESLQQDNNYNGVTDNMSHATAGSGIFFLLQMNGQYSPYLLLSVCYFILYLLPALNCKGGALELSKTGKKG